ncbi:MAG: hypothetical protein LBU91_00625 [Bacteroidales bacterium]|jgi:hypothetical protein|nr:hypothetical protein [Bacteroidales bacterium]
MTENKERVETIAKALGELSEQVVFVGGSVVEFYADAPNTSDIRPTLDVDCVIPIQSRSKYWKLEEKLRQKKFQNDSSTGAPICRWIFAGIVVDIMPDDPNILGFSNQWYKAGIEHRIKHQISESVSIYILPVEYYLATKFEALQSRGGSDWRGSSDLEDIIYILNNTVSIVHSIQTTMDSNLKNYLQENIRLLLKEPNITEIIECMLSFDEQNRKTYIYDILLELSQEKN